MDYSVKKTSFEHLGGSESLFTLIFLYGDLTLLAIWLTRIHIVDREVKLG